MRRLVRRSQGNVPVGIANHSGFNATFTTSLPALTSRIVSFSDPPDREMARSRSSYDRVGSPPVSRMTSPASRPTRCTVPPLTTWVICKPA